MWALQLPLAETQEAHAAGSALPVAVVLRAVPPGMKAKVPAKGPLTLVSVGAAVKVTGPGDVAALRTVTTPALTGLPGVVFNAGTGPANATLLATLVPVSVTDEPVTVKPVAATVRVLL